MRPVTIPPKSANRASIAVAAAALMALIAVPASAQNLPPPGNINPGSLDSGAEQTGAPNQPRSPGNIRYYNYRAPAVVVVPHHSAYYNSYPHMRAAPFYSGEYWDY